MEIVRAVNWVDVLIVILLIRTCYIGTKTGLTCELQKSFGLVTGFAVSYKYHKQLAEYISARSFLSLIWAEVIVLGVVIIFVQLAVKLAAILLSKIATLQFKPKFEQVGGGILGCARGIFLASVLLVLLGMMPSAYLHDSIYERSLSAGYIVNVSIGIYNFLAKLLRIG